MGDSLVVEEPAEPNLRIRFDSGCPQLSKISTCSLSSTARRSHKYRGRGNGNWKRGFSSIESPEPSSEQLCSSSGARRIVCRRNGQKRDAGGCERDLAGRLRDAAEERQVSCGRESELSAVELHGRGQQIGRAQGIARGLSRKGQLVRTCFVGVDGEEVTPPGLPRMQCAKT